MTKKQNSVKTCTRSLKKEKPRIYGNRFSFDQNRKSCQYKAGMNWLKLYKSGYSENSFCKNFPQQQQLASSSYPRTQPLVKFLNNTCLRSDFSAIPLSKLNIFSFCRKRCTTTINPYPHLMILQCLQFILFCVRKVILYQIVFQMSKRLFVLMTLYTSWTRRNW